MSAALVILVTGLPATGKSRLAGELALRFRIPLIAKDAIKEPLFDVLGQRDRAWSRSLSDAAFAVAFGLARTLLLTERPFILEGNFRPGEHEEALRVLAAQAPLLQILCVVPETERRARLAARALESNRHPGHAAPPADTSGANGFLELPGRRATHDGAGGDAAIDASCLLLA
jgi:predicted kinase